jgi:thiamine phosphate synthase YjbQ (UPF0047 family)
MQEKNTNAIMDLRCIFLNGTKNQPSCTYVAAITNGKLDFGTWEQIFYGEYDGKREKRVLVKIVGE